MSSKKKTTSTKDDGKRALVPKLRFQGFPDAEGWEGMRLGELCERIMDGTHFSPKSKSGPKPYLTSKNIRDGRIDLSDLCYISEDEHREIYKRCPVKKGDVLLTKDGANTGNCALNNLDFEFSLLSSVAVLRGDAAKVSQQFLFQTIVSDRTRHLIEDSMSGQAITRITLEKLGKYVVPVPSVAEQQKIAECLSSVDELIAAQARKVDALKTHKKGLMQQLFPREGETQPRLRFPEFQNAGEWEPKTIGAVCKLKAGEFVSASAIAGAFKDGLFSCYGGNGLRGYVQSFTHEGTYVLIGRQGALCGNVNLFHGKFHATEHALVVTPNKGIATSWLYYAMDFLDLNRFSIGQAQPGLSVGVLNSLEFSIPRDEQEQQHFASCLTSLDDLITAQTQKLEALKTHKKGLMQQLFPSPAEVEA